MKIAQRFIIGASYICLFRSRITTATGALSSVQQTCSMSNSKCAADEKYEVGSSSVAFVTTPDATSAKNIAHGLLNQKLAACVNILPQITSIYHWEGKMNEDEEVLLIIKTRSSRVEELTKYVRENHPYSVAEVITLPIENGSLPYLKWIHNTVPEKQ